MAVTCVTFCGYNALKYIMLRDSHGKDLSILRQFQEDLGLVSKPWHQLFDFSVYYSTIQD